MGGDKIKFSAIPEGVKKLLSTFELFAGERYGDIILSESRKKSLIDHMTKTKKSELLKEFMAIFPAKIKPHG